FKEYQERYEIDFKNEFYVKELIKLKLQYQNTPDEHIRAKTDLMNLILKLEQQLALKEKRKIKKVFDDYELLIVGTNIEHFKELIKGFNSSNIVSNIISTNNQIHIKLLTGLNIRFICIPIKQDGEFNADFNVDYYRGIRCNEYWNLTGSEKVERWLKTTLCR
ncbi:MAG TPA: hypothetical protein VK982_01880, partial [Bacteroidales bacterium]|nr:hypothetical protein [Bacteroidales bacterium]